MHWLGFFDFLELKTYDYRFNNVRGPLTGWRASDSTIIDLGTMLSLLMLMMRHGEFYLRVILAGLIHEVIYGLK